MFARAIDLAPMPPLGVSLRGAEEVNQGTMTVYLPEAHVLTPEALRKLARARSLEQWITYNADGVPHADHV
jgi:hypothetical protein